jgi:hypothetical protein
MGVFRFNPASTTTIVFATLATALQNVSDGAWTIACPIRFNALGGGNFRALGYFKASGVVKAGLSINAIGPSPVVDLGSGPTASGINPSTGTDYMYVAAHTSAGTVTFSRYTKSSNTWDHNTPATTLSNQIASDSLEIGAWQGADLLDGWMPAFAAWEGKMDQTNVEALSVGWKTSSLYSSAFGAPLFLTQLNTTSPTDMMGNASGLTVTGGSVDSGQTVSDWLFDGTGVDNTMKPGLPGWWDPQINPKGWF